MLRVRAGGARRLVGLTLAAALLAPPAAACGAWTDCGLRVEGKARSYRIHVPDGARPPLGAILFHHGYRGTAAGTMRNAGLRALAARLGVALVAAQADGVDWQIPNLPRESRRGTDALAYADALRVALAERHGIEPGRILVAGFSSGGMMTWTLACARGGDYGGFAPVAGTFWAPVPELCPSRPASLVHVHGRADRVVPLEGRAIAEARQGDVGEAVAMYARRGGFRTPRPERRGGLDCLASGNADGRVLDLCLHDGGHDFRAGFLEMAWRRIGLGGVGPGD